MRRPLFLEIVMLMTGLVAASCRSDNAITEPIRLNGPGSVAPAAGEGEEARGVAQVDMEAARADLVSAVSGYSTVGTQQDVITVFGAMLASDVRYLEFGEPILVGRAAVLQLIQSDPTYASATQSWHPIRVDVSADGLHGYTFGYTQTVGGFGPGGATATIAGKFIAYWRKDGSGNWNAVAYVQNFQRVIIVAEAPPGFESPSYKHYRYFPRTDAASQRTLLMAVDNAFAARALVVGPGQAFFEYAAEDAAVLSGQPSILFGRDTIKGTFANFPPNGQLLWHAVDADVAASGDLGFTVGEAESHTFNPDGSPRVVYTKYLTVWKRQLTGDWLFEIDGGNARPAP